jgi:hypothetical protein
MAEATSRLAAAPTGRYRIENQLGQGGMATVYLAQDVRHERKAAMIVRLRDPRPNGHAPDRSCAHRNGLRASEFGCGGPCGTRAAELSWPGLFP